MTPTTHPPDHDGRLSTADGVDLAYRAWLPERPVAAVALLHGYAEHGLRYARVASALAERHALAVHSVDFRGHGDSDGARGHVESFADYHHDVDALRQQIQATHPRLPIAMLAHSMGGLVATDYLIARGAEECNVVGCALSSPYFGLRRPLLWIERLVVHPLARWSPRFGLPVDLAGTALCTDPEIAREHDADPKIFGKATARWVRESVAAHARVLSRTQELTLPMLVLYGTDDCIASPGATARLAAQLPHGEAEAVDEKHELLNAAEPTRSRLIDRYGIWLATRAATHSTSR